MTNPANARIYFTRPGRGSASAMTQLFEIIHQDAELLVINKPAGLVCHPTKGDEWSSLVSRVRLHVGAAVRPHLVNRLDRETSGVVLVALQDETARELRRLWEERLVQKEYWAIVQGHVAEEQGTIAEPLGKDCNSKIAIKDCVLAGGTAARTDFNVIRRFDRPEGSFTWLKVMPHTGRKHQIRIHLAHYRHPIVGDKLYGGDEDLYMALVEDRLTDEQKRRLIFPHHALHAREVRFNWRGREILFRAEPEEWFKAFVPHPP